MSKRLLFRAEKIVRPKLVPANLEEPSAPPPLKRKRGSSIKKIDIPPEFMTIDEAAEFWRCHRRKVERKLKKKEIQKYKDGHRTLLKVADVRAHSRAMRQK
jgi:excisionase family DNA binding protein